MNGPSSTRTAWTPTIRDRRLTETSFPITVPSMSEHDIDDLPELREVDVLLSEAEVLSESCRFGLDQDAMALAFGDALSIMIELRVPRAPETEEEWKESLAAAMEGEALSSEEVFDGLRDRMDRFSVLLDRFRAHVRAREWNPALGLITDGGDDGLISWNRHAIAIEDDGLACTATIMDPHGLRTSFETTGTTVEGAALAALLDAHRRMHRIWRR